MRWTSATSDTKTSVNQALNRPDIMTEIPRFFVWSDNETPAAIFTTLRAVTQLMEQTEP